MERQALLASFGHSTQIPENGLERYEWHRISRLQYAKTKQISHARD
jgi:hypothetical protein